MKICSLAMALSLFLSAVAVQHTQAGDNILWTTDGVPVCTAFVSQAVPQIVGDGTGGAIITWQDLRTGKWELWAQRLDLNGDSLWASNGVLVCSPDFGAMNPQMATDGSSDAIIIWEDWRGASLDLYAQRIDANGDTVWQADGVPISLAANNQTSPQIVPDDSGGAVMVWEDIRSGSHYDVYAQRVDANGNRIWAVNGQAICTFSDQQERPQLIGDGAGGAIIVWQDRRNGTTYGIYAQWVDANGNTKWTGDGEVICNASNDQLVPRIVADGLGGAIITWHDYRSGSHYDIYTQWVDANGDVLWTNNGEAICTEANNQNSPQSVADGSGGAVIAWRDYRDGGSNDIYAQRVDANGNMLWTHDGVPICTAANNQAFLRIASDGSSGAIILWSDNRSGSKWDIYAQRIDGYGDTLVPADGEAICAAMNNQSEPQLYADGSGGAIITWDDYRTGSEYDIYAQRVHFNPAAHITSIADVPDDQGGQVTIIWDRSYMDDPWYKVITEYSIWRKYPAGSKSGFVGQVWDGSLPKNRDQGIYRLIEERGASGEIEAKAWEYIGTVGANYFESYAYMAPTMADSSGSGIPYFSFIVTAHTQDPFVHWDSAPDSGYSVDDVNPTKTQVTVLTWGSAKGPVNTVWLVWDEVTTGVDGSPEHGSIEYWIYCDEDPGFTPVPGNLLATTNNFTYAHTDARIGDPAANLFYLVAVIDGSDNESAVSNVVGEFDKSMSN